MDGKPGVRGFEIPENGIEIIKIGSSEFEFIEDRCTTKMYFSMNVAIAAKAVDLESEDLKLLSHESVSDEEMADGEIEISLNLKNICKKGVPDGEFIFDTGSTNDSYNIRFITKGINPNLRFNGRVAVKNGWIGINGVFKGFHQTQPAWPIEIYKKIPIEELVWTQYSYTLEETAGMKPELVTSVYMEGYRGTEFPQQVLEFSGLTHLKLIGAFGNENAIAKLPNELGSLKQLVFLSVENTTIEELPSSIFKLPKLEHLSLTRSQLQKLPDDIDLPQLRHANFYSNQLSTVPESLALQPKLVDLELDENPWQSLPLELNNIEQLRLNFDDKRRFLNYQNETLDLGEWKDHYSRFIADSLVEFESKNPEVKWTAMGVFASVPYAWIRICFDTTSSSNTYVEKYRKPDNDLLAEDQHGQLCDNCADFMYPDFAELMLAEWRRVYEQEDSAFRYKDVDGAEFRITNACDETVNKVLFQFLNQIVEEQLPALTILAKNREPLSCFTVQMCFSQYQKFWVLPNQE